VGEDTREDTRRRLSVSEAADALGITVDAVRSRVKRDTIAHVREGGRVYVLLGADESRPGYDQDTDQVGDQGARQAEDRTAELIATLREQLQAERQAHAEARRLLAAALERIPAIEAPQEPTEAAETVEDVLDTERARREMAESTLREGMAEEQRRREEAERERDNLRRELHALREPRESSQTVEEEPERAEPRPATAGPQESTWRRWRRRWFGN
jgi:hypothetical protein